MEGGFGMRHPQSRGEDLHSEIEGAGRYPLADRKVNDSAGHLWVLDRGVLHDVEALEESALRLTITWRRKMGDTAESFSSTQRLLDEATMSRMDDEGVA
jgi:hypothetical protein